jgi:hypothetical protein
MLMARTRKSPGGISFRLSGAALQGVLVVKTIRDLDTRDWNYGSTVSLKKLG